MRCLLVRAYACFIPRIHRSHIRISDGRAMICRLEVCVQNPRMLSPLECAKIILYGVAVTDSERDCTRRTTKLHRRPCRWNILQSTLRRCYGREVVVPVHRRFSYRKPTTRKNTRLSTDRHALVGSCTFSESDGDCGGQGRGVRLT